MANKPVDLFYDGERVRIIGYASNLNGTEGIVDGDSNTHVVTLRIASGPYAGMKLSIRPYNVETAPRVVA